MTEWWQKARLDRLRTTDGDARGRHIGSLLEAAGKLDRAGIAKVLELQKVRGLRFGEAALRLRLITADDLRAAVGEQYAAPAGVPDTERLSPELIVARQPLHPRSEQLRALRTRLTIRWSSLGVKRRTLAIVSPSARDGRSYIAANLAVLFGHLGWRTLLIDADLRAPRQFEIFNVPGRVGLSAVLSGRASDDALIRLPAFGSLSILPAGPSPPNPQELLLRPAFAGFLNAMERQFDVILLDTSAALDSADVHAAAQCAGSAMILARADHTRLDAAVGLACELRAAGVTVLGGALNAIATDAAV
jgi:protein-tyrosine kinase